MTILNLTGMNDPLLKMKLEKFNFSSPPTDPVQLSRDLTETMISLNGLGLAANQCGLPYRVFVVKSNPVYACFNPEIVDHGEEISDNEEGCLTYPNLFIKVKRYTAIRIRFTLPNGLTDTYKFAGLTARIMQHELDHLNGIRFTDHVGKLSLQMAIKKATKGNVEGRKFYYMSDFK